MTSPRSGATVPTGDQVPGAGGKPGRSGRKTLAFKAECAYLTDHQVLEKVRTFLETHDLKGDAKKDATWKWCAEYVTQYSKGKPATVLVPRGLPLPTGGTPQDDDDLDALSDQELFARIRDLGRRSGRLN